MAFSDLQYGWTAQSFILRDVRLVRAVRLEERDADGEWSCPRGDSEAAPPAASGGEKMQMGQRTSSLRAGIDASIERRYDKPTRFMTAKACVPDDIYTDMFLGVPEDKKSIRDSEKRLQFLKLSIRESPSVFMEDAEAGLGFGVVQYIEPSEYSDEYVYAQFDGVQAEVMDHLEKAIGGRAMGLEVSLGIKCWHWLGPIGDSQIYIANSKDLQLAQLLSIEAYTPGTDRVADVLDEKAEQGMDYKAELAEIRQQLASIVSQGRSIRTAIEIVAVAAVVIAAVALF